MKKEYWIIKDTEGKLVVNKVYNSEEEAQFELTAHPQYFNSYDEQVEEAAQAYYESIVNQ